MAWTAVENFDSYSDGDLAGNNGGSGWSGAWANGAVEVIDVNGTQTYQGAKSVTDNSAVNNAFYTRDLTSAVTGDGNIVYLAMRKGSTSSGLLNVSIRNSGSGNRAEVRFNTSGNLVLVGTTTATILAGYSADTFYAIRLTFNVTAGTSTAAYSTGTFGGGGSWSSESSAVTMNNSGNIDRIGLGRDAGTSTDYWDYISGTDPLPASTSVKTIDGLAKASVKTVNGLAIASVKSVNGLE